jgi:2-polyprenyl-6-methoxyphenol hydroxylase-like FAD-dependent oxidoreductase
LVDGVALAEALATAPSVEEALAHYDRRRRPAAHRIQNTAGLLQRLCNLRQTTAMRLRDALLVGLTRFPRISEEGIRRGLASDVQAIRTASVLAR